MGRRIIAIGMVKDEADIIASTIAHLAGQVDWVYVLDNLSSDGTAEILHELTNHLPLTVIRDRQPAYFQSHKMTRLARRAAAEQRAGWIIPFDADEAIVTTGGTLRELLDDCPADEMILPWVNHRPTGIDPTAVLDPLVRMAWRERQPQTLPKVIARWRPGLTIAQGNHSARYPTGHHRQHSAQVVVHHFPWRSVEQVVRKITNGVAAYKAAGSQLPKGAGIHWKQLGAQLEAEGPRAVERVFYRDWWVANPPRSGLISDPVKEAARA